MKKLYINGYACLPGQPPTADEDWADVLGHSDVVRYTVAEPDYAEWIAPNQLRRMNRLTRMAMATALRALQGAGLTAVDAIVTATGYGCIASTYQFLERLLGNGDLPMNPSAFIQSTHNTPGSQLALQLRSHGYNNTLSADYCAFELALDDAIAYANDSGAQQLLVGGFDELTPQLLAVMQQLEAVSHRPMDTVGEGSAFFVLSPQPQPASLAIKHFEIGCQQAVEAALRPLQKEYPFGVLLVNSATKERLSEEGASIVPFDYTLLSGNYPTSGAYACWLACESLRQAAEQKREKQNNNNIATLSITKEGMASLLIIGRE